MATFTASRATIYRALRQDVGQGLEVEVDPVG